MKPMRPSETDLLVSHDRDLLGPPVRAVPLPGTRRGGPAARGLSEGAREAARERTALVRARDHASHEVKQLHRELDRRREQTAQGERQRSKRGLARGDRDARAKVDAARCTDSGSGQRLRQLEGRMHQALEREAGLQLTRAFTLGLALEGQRSPRDLLLALPPGDLALGGSRRLRVPALVLRPEERSARISSAGWSFPTGPGTRR